MDQDLEGVFDDEDDSWMAEVEESPSPKPKITPTTKPILDQDFGDVFDDGDDTWLASAEESLSPKPKTETKPKIPPPSKEHLRSLEKWFGHKNFKPIQWDIVHSILEGRQDQCIVMATGYGKSLCYQYPPVFEGKTSLVVSPLIALMEDQVLALQVNNIQSCFLGSAQSEKEESYRDIKAGKMRVVYVTPEFIDVSHDLLASILPEKSLSLVAIDEAHCVSQWGHDFRAAYRHLNKIRRIYKNAPILALTATATDVVIKDICSALSLRNPKISKTSFDRSNLYIEVSSKSGNTWKDLSSVLESSDDPYSLKKNFSGPTIIYCPTRKDVDNVTETLNSHGLKALPYHAGLGNKERSYNQKEFVRDRCDVIVCTVAFGMGINKPDVRNVIHYGAPKDMESYYQEIGRAGRDGEKSLVKVFYSAGDFQTHRYLLSDTKNEIWKKHKTNLLHKMEIYLAMKKSCRRKEILKHFQENMNGSSEERRENCCDNCSSAILFSTSGSNFEMDEKVDFTEDARLLLESVRDCKGYYGLGIPVAVLKGAHDKKMKDYLTRLEIFGKAKTRKTKDFYMALGRALIAEDYIGQTTVHGKNSFRSYCTVHISDKGQSFLNNPQAFIRLVPTKNMIAEKKPPTVVNVRPTVASFSAPISPDREELYKKLFDLRNDIATKSNLAPYMIFNEETLHQFSEIRPSSFESFSKMGVVEAKLEKFGAPFLETITEWSKKKGLKMDNFPPDNSSNDDDSLDMLSETQRASYQMFLEYSDLEKVSASRGLKPSTIITHLCEAIKLGLPMNIEKLGINDSVKKQIEEVIASPAIDSNVLRLGPIKDECEKKMDEVSWDAVKVVVAILMARHGVIDNKLQWNPNSVLNAENENTTDNLGKNEPENNREEERPNLKRQLSSTSSSSSVSTSSASRKIPEWMSNNATRKEVMAKKIKKNSLFK